MSGTAVSREARTFGITGSAKARTSCAARDTTRAGAGSACRRRCRALPRARHNCSACSPDNASQPSTNASGQKDAYGMLTGAASRLPGTTSTDARGVVVSGNVRDTWSDGATSVRDTVHVASAGGSHSSGTAGTGIRPTTSFNETSHHSHTRTAAGSVGTVRHRPHTTPATIVASTEARKSVSSSARLPVRSVSTSNTSVMTTSSPASAGVPRDLRVRPVAQASPRPRRPGRPQTARPIRPAFGRRTCRRHP